MEQIQRKKMFFKVRNTLLEMLKDRNYDINDSEFNISFDVFSAMYSENKQDLVFNKKNEENKIYVHFYIESKNFGKKELTNILTVIDEKYGSDNINILIVLEDKPTSTIQKELEENDNIEIFFAKKLMFNITKHVLIPKHKLLNESEIKEILDKYQCKKNQLPKIQYEDPVARYYGAKVGDVFEIVRPTPTTGIFKVYRVVK
jgi:DNA-directed RNA polymerases I, II, and III subunit RPABC1